jgi:flavorubredoxin
LREDEKMVDVIVIYDTLGTGYTEKAAQEVMEGVRSSGADAVLKKAEDTKEADLKEPTGIIIGSPNVNDNFSGRTREFVEGPLKNVHPDSKVGAAFGTHKWNTLNVHNLEKAMINESIRLVAPGVNATHRMNDETVQKLRELGAAVGREALKIKAKK